MSQVVDVDEEALKCIADSMRNLINEMDRVCGNIEKNLDESIPLMQDESGKKACDSIHMDIANLRKIFPNVLEFSNTCYEVIRYMQDATDSMSGV